MILLANILMAVATIIGLVLQFFIFLILARVILSWVNADPYNPLVRLITSACDPIFYRLRRFLPLTIGGIDFTPFIVLIIIVFLQQALVVSLQEYATELKLTR